MWPKFNIIWAKLNLSELASGLLRLQYVTYGAVLGELQGSLCALLLVLRCIVALLADRSRSIFAFLQIIADSAFWASPTPVFIFVDDFNTIVRRSITLKITDQYSLFIKHNTEVPTQFVDLDNNDFKIRCQKWPEHVTCHYKTVELY